MLEERTRSVFFGNSSRFSCGVMIRYSGCVWEEEEGVGSFGVSFQVRRSCGARSVSKQTVIHNTTMRQKKNSPSLNIQLSRVNVQGLGNVAVDFLVFFLFPPPCLNLEKFPLLLLPCLSPLDSLIRKGILLIK